MPAGYQKLTFNGRNFSACHYSSYLRESVITETENDSNLMLAKHGFQTAIISLSLTLLPFTGGVRLPEAELDLYVLSPFIYHIIDILVCIFKRERSESQDKQRCIVTDYTKLEHESALSVFGFSIQPRT